MKPHDLVCGWGKGVRGAPSFALERPKGWAGENRRERGPSSHGGFAGALHSAAKVGQKEDSKDLPRQIPFLKKQKTARGMSRTVLGTAELAKSHGSLHQMEKGTGTERM